MVQYLTEISFSEVGHSISRRRSHKERNVLLMLALVFNSANAYADFHLLIMALHGDGQKNRTCLA